MNKARMEAFSDSVIAIIITISVIGLVPPQTSDLDALLQMKEQFLAYGLSFFILAIYWVNHHNLLKISDKISRQALWANMLNLFSISLFPFVTTWIGKNFNSLVPAFLHGVVFLTAMVTFTILQYCLIKCNGKDSKIANNLTLKKPLICISLAIIALLLGFISPILTPIAVFLISAMWIIPSKTIKHILDNN